MQIPILSGIYTDNLSDFKVSYPKNLIPVPVDHNLSSGYLRPAEGIIHLSNVSGIDRGGVNWNETLYRVCGSKLVRVSEGGIVSEIGTVINDGKQASFDYSYDRLAITSGGELFYYDGWALTQVTDDDLGLAKTVIWVDGYFMTTDGDSLVVTDLSDPFSINPLKYGSSEADPDEIKSLLKIRNEVHAVNRYTIEVFQNVGGTVFPFSRVSGGQIMKGSVGEKTCCQFMESIAFIGGGRNEPVSVWVGRMGQSSRISSRDIDQLIQSYSLSQLEASFVESRVVFGHDWLYIHLPNDTLVYDDTASRMLNKLVWFSLSSGIRDERYYGTGHVFCYGNWYVGNPISREIGVLSNDTGSHWGNVVEWELGTTIVYNESNGAIFHELELVCLSGRAALGDNPVIRTQYSLDGVSWSQPSYISAGRIGGRSQRLIWFRQGNMKSLRMQKFVGTSDSRLSIARLEAKIQPLVY